MVREEWAKNGRAPERGTSLRTIIEVKVGLHPQHEIPEYTRRFIITGEEWDGGSEAGCQLFADIVETAMAYAGQFMDPRLCNYVRVEWLWA